jgi:Fe-S-cluster formation regulator IscX/YfhJ
VRRYDWIDVKEIAESLFDEYEYMLPWFRDVWNIVMFEKIVTIGLFCT